MVKILVINTWLHHKNIQGLTNILNYLLEQQQIEYKVGSVEDIPNYDVIYSPSLTINAAQYPNKKFIFGPHFSTFPNQQQLQSLQNINNSIYLQPSDWVVKLWKNQGAEQFLPIKSFPFPVDTNKFQPNQPSEKRQNIMIYFKSRNPQDLHNIKEFLHRQNRTNYRVFEYNRRYDENDYLAYLQTCQYGIILDAHESQGFAIEEAMACDVPLLVWNTTSMNQEYGNQNPDIPCTTIPYWAPTCGEFFSHHTEFLSTFQIFQSKLADNQYNPRQYILDNLSTEKCAERFMELIKF
jgi:glycosyltransferase involved in cell wall biosynthesis